MWCGHTAWSSPWVGLVNEWFYLSLSIYLSLARSLLSVSLAVSLFHSLSSSLSFSRSLSVRPICASWAGCVTEKSGWPVAGGGRGTGAATTIMCFGQQWPPLRWRLDRTDGSCCWLSPGMLAMPTMPYYVAVRVLGAKLPTVSDWSNTKTRHG